MNLLDLFFHHRKSNVADETCHIAPDGTLIGCGSVKIIGWYATSEDLARGVIYWLMETNVKSSL